MTDRGLTLRADVALVPLDRSHAAAMYRWMCDPVVAEGIGLTAEPSLERTHAWLDAAAAGETVAGFGIMLADHHVGNVVLDQIARPVGSARLSVYIGEPSERGAGLGTTAVYLAVERAFEVLRLHKVWLTVYEGNGKAIRCYTRLGFRVDGTLRDDFLLRGERRNALLMSLLDGELASLDAAGAGA